MVSQSALERGRADILTGKLKSAKSEAAVEELSKSVPDVLSAPVEHQIPAREKAEEVAIRDVIARMKQTLAASGDRGMNSQSRYFDWMGCHPGNALHPVSRRRMPQCPAKRLLVMLNDTRDGRYNRSRTRHVQYRPSMCRYGKNSIDTSKKGMRAGLS